ncbi:MAG: zinc-dependent metalloprotease family protein, partial [Chitinophagaceae bacterium]
MRKFCGVVLTLIPVILFSFTLSAQNNFFTATNESGIPANAGQRMIVPQTYRVFALNVDGMKNFLWSLPSESNALNRIQNSATIELPMPGGTTAKFRVWESSMMEAGLASKFPGIKTFSGQGIDDPTATIKMDWTSRGFHAMVLSDITGNIFIDPYRQADINNYTIYFQKDLSYNKNFFEESYPQAAQEINNQAREMAGPCVGTSLRSYRLALACTFEYARAVSLPNPPDVNLALAAMTTSMNRVNGVYEKELAIRMVFVNNITSLIYIAEPDPYTNNAGTTMLGENQTNVDGIIGSANYDIGHVFSTGGGGVATLNGPCGNNKARGVTGLANPTGDAFDIDFVAHEMGHQFGGSHTFNATTGNCGGTNRSGATAMEPGSGVTIMGYAGICGANDLAAHSIANFHGISFDQISTFVSSGGGSGCPLVTPITNSIPVVTAGANFTIPRSTP